MNHNKTLVLHLNKNRQVRRAQLAQWRNHKPMATRRKMPTRFLLALYLIWWAFMIIGGVK